MKRLLVLPFFLLAACSSTPDVVPADEAAPTDAAGIQEQAGEAAAEGDAAMAADGGEGMMAEAPTPVPDEPTVVDESAPEGALAVNYEASSVTFVGKSSIVDHPGTFKKFRAVMLQEEEGNWLKTQFRFDIDLRQIATDSEMLDAHLQKEDFFDTAKYPVATFTSDGGVWPRDDGGFDIDGVLTVKGVTKPVTVPFMVEDNTVRLHLDFPRKDFGVGNDSYGDKLLDDVMPVDGVIVLE